MDPLLLCRKTQQLVQIDKLFFTRRENRGLEEGEVGEEEEEEQKQEEKFPSTKSIPRLEKNWGSILSADAPVITTLYIYISVYINTVCLLYTII